MSDEGVRWLTIDTPSSAEVVCATLQAAIEARRARSSWRRGFAGTVDKQRFTLKASSGTKEFSVEGLLNPTEEGTRVVVSVTALRHRPLLQMVVPLMVVIGGCLVTWYEASGDPDWPETGLIATGLILGAVAVWFSTVGVTTAEAERIRARLAEMVVPVSGERSET